MPARSLLLNDDEGVGPPLEYARVAFDEAPNVDTDDIGVAVLNALLRATTVTGSGRTVGAIPLDRLRAGRGSQRKLSIIIRSDVPHAASP